MNILKKIKNFVVFHKIPVIILSLTVTLFIGGIILLSNKELSNHETIEEPIKNDPIKDNKPTKDFPKIEPSIFETEDPKPEIEEKIEKNYTKEYKAYENLPEEEKKELDVIPRKEEVPISKIDDIKEEIDNKKDDDNQNNENNENNKDNEDDEDDEEVKTIPASYNLKDHISIKVENQGEYGLCWAFASLNSLETNILLNEKKDLDLSELHLDYHQSNLMYGDREIHDGGDFETFKNYSLLSGAVLEEDVPYRSIATFKANGQVYSYYKLNNYKENKYSKFTNLKSVARPTQVVDFPTVRKTNGVVEDISEDKLIEFRNVIKSHIMKNGSIYAGISNPFETNNYCSHNCTVDHAVSIVGWDDNYKKENFTDKDGKHPLHDGAYIFLNSWGEENGDDGYFYISYDDQLVELEMSGVISASMDNAIKLDTIKNQVIKDIIHEKLKYYIIDYNNNEYITKLALEKVDTLELKSKNLTSDDLKGLEIFNNLTAIDLSDNSITDISVLSKLKKLYSINLSNNKVTDVSTLKNLKDLGTINLSGNNFITGYEYLNNLYELDLSNTNLTTLNDITNNENLSQINLSNNTKLDYNTLKLPKNISNLSLDNTNLSNNSFISNLKNLHSLSIKNNNLKNLDSLEKIPSLVSLDVSNNEIKDFSALNKIVEKMQKYGERNYIELIANSNNISNISIFNNIMISSLDLSNNKISDLTNFNNNNIEVIKLSNNKIEKGIKSLKNVPVIYLDHCNISDLTDISEFKKLTSLNLDNNNITDITPLNKIKSLDALSLSGNKNIKGKLTGNIFYLNLKDCNLNNNFDFSGLKALSQMDISNNQFIDMYNLIKNIESEWISIDAENIAITEEQLLKFQSSLNNKGWNIFGAKLNLTLNLDSNNNISLDNKYYIRKLLMQELNSNVKIENGIIDNKAEFIHVVDPKKRSISFNTNFTIDHFRSLNVNITF